MGSLFHVLKVGVKDFFEDECMSNGAAMAFYTFIALPPLLVTVFLVADAAGVARERVDKIVREQIGLPTVKQGDGEGDDAGLMKVAEQTEQQKGSVGNLGIASRVLGIALLIFSASGVFMHLQKALNRAWEVAPDPDQGGIKNFLMKRALSLGMLVVIAFLLLVSLILTTLIDEISGWVVGRDPGTVGVAIGILLNSLVTLVIATLLFAAIFKFLPDAKTDWKDLWVGALITALLFVVGKALMGWWLQRSDVGGNWGAAAASVISMLMWVYYSSLIILMGAEITQAWANLHGKGIVPEEGAVRIEG